MDGANCESKGGGAEAPSLLPAGMVGSLEDAVAGADPGGMQVEGIVSAYYAALCVRAHAAAAAGMAGEGSGGGGGGGNGEAAAAAKAEAALEAFDRRFHPRALARLESMEEEMAALLERSGGGGGSEGDGDGGAYDRLREVMSAVEFARQYGRGLANGGQRRTGGAKAPGRPGAGGSGRRGPGGGACSGGASGTGGSSGGEDLPRLQRDLASSLPGGPPGGGRLVEAVPFDGGGGGGAAEGPRRSRVLLAFAAASPIYAGAGGTAEIGGVRCTVLEGNVDRLWLGSVRNERSRAPFSPTWLVSAYELAAAARDAGCTEAVDIGSGDGRIAHCAAALGLRSHSIELDGALAGAQRGIADRTGVRVDVRQADASSFDYASLGLSRPAFFVGGLAQMGGDALAAAAVSHAAAALPGGAALFVLPGTLSPKYAPDPGSMGGWGRTVAGAGMSVERTVPLPAAWTLGEADAVQYVLARTGGAAA